MELKYTDNFTSKYKYGRLYPIGVPYGTKFHDILEKSNNWKLKNRENNIAKMNDNRMDRNYGFSDKYIYEATGQTVSVHCERSATGKTLNWTFTSNDIEDQEELELLLKVAFK